MGPNRAPNKPQFWGQRGSENEPNQAQDGHKMRVWAPQGKRHFWPFLDKFCKRCAFRGATGVKNRPTIAQICPVYLPKGVRIIFARNCF